MDFTHRQSELPLLSLEFDGACENLRSGRYGQRRLAPRRWPRCGYDGLVLGGEHPLVETLLSGTRRTVLTEATSDDPEMVALAHMGVLAEAEEITLAPQAWDRGIQGGRRHACGSEGLRAPDSEPATGNATRQTSAS